jgi:hypothetical protein
VRARQRRRTENIIETGQLDEVFHPDQSSYTCTETLLVKDIHEQIWILDLQDPKSQDKRHRDLGLDRHLDTPDHGNWQQRIKPIR